MLKREVVIVNRLGLHVRAAHQLVKLASRYASDIRVQKEGRAVNAKDIMDVMMLAARQGHCLEIQANGEDAEQALESLVKLVQDRFGEDE